MSEKTPKNIAASVRQRLLNKARNDHRPFNELLQYFAIERFLYRLSRSTHADKFILKGALMLRVWQAPLFRPTMDIDMLGRNTENEVEKIVKQVYDICLVEVESDGLEFNTESVKGERITEDADYEGVRIRFVAQLETAKIPMQMDIGFGDVVVPGPQEVILPTILDFPPPYLFGYSLESAIAEKFEAMVKLGELNSRMKDFYDIWLLSRQFDFMGERLKDAVSETLKNRGTNLPSEIVAFSNSFLSMKSGQWQAFHRRLGQENIPADFAEIMRQVKIFLYPIVESIRSGMATPSNWEAPGPWG
ncbi:MAG: nucleotidyl transferase AbiEii/AbiGii toxin family protein [Proteobacteria bacterium]|nr:nucleotidyl transferase AbiEii/AbiGii toxin family protein [Pseudomonadota bacterium]MBU0965032.1 nucleotidyl transferase AbiEii/AbiGii toxin family protein [Pseudomonadota bacterium]